LRRRLVFAAAFLVAFGAATASAELAQKGNLFVRFDGGISPRDLPRHSLAPIAVRIEGTIRVPPGQEPPALRRISVALNRSGRLSTRGLPRCRTHQIDSATTVKALEICGRALVGTGGITARTSFPEQPTHLLRGEILLFNSVVGGRRAILAHIFQRDPAPITRIVVFNIRRSRGALGTVISGRLPEVVSRNGYLKTISLQLQRRYRFRGRDRSYLSASCAAPAGFTVATFPFANTSMTFDDGRTLSSTLVRSCAVR
jgi:hypothetical protein